MDQLRLRTGAGSFSFEDRSTQRTIRAHYFVPQAIDAGGRMTIALHGLDRAAGDFRDCLIPAAQKYRQVVLVPEFDAEQFPDAHAYNYGGVCEPPPSSVVRPKHLWTFGIIDRLFASVGSAIDCDVIDCDLATFNMFGNSAGAQFVLRYLAVTDACNIGRAVVANSGWYMLPDLKAAYPNGLGGLGLTSAHVRRLFGRNLTLLIGTSDNDSAAPDLPRMAAAMAQGPHRLARGQWYFDHCRQHSVQLGAMFRWQLRLAENAGHIDPLIFERGLQILSGGGDA